MLTLVNSLLNSTALRDVQESLANVEFVDGKQTAGEHARKVKRNTQAKGDSEATRHAGQLIVNSLSQSRTVRLAAQPKAILAPLIARYGVDMEYGAHIDEPLMGASAIVRTDVSVTVFLSEPDEYDGGELVIVTDMGEELIKGKAGDAILYPSSFLHRVAPITRGFRLVAVTWIQSMIRDHRARQILFDLTRAADGLTENPEQHESAALIRKSASNLLRMWAEV